MAKGEFRKIECFVVNFGYRIARMASAHIRPVVSANFDQWRRLYQGYADFYQVALSDYGVQATWSWLIEPAHVCTGLVAKQPDGLVGLAAFSRHAKRTVWLDDRVFR